MYQHSGPGGTSVPTPLAGRISQSPCELLAWHCQVSVTVSNGSNIICIFVCSDGVGRSGAFIASHAEMERMKAETVVDLFQFIKAARVKRAGLVANKVANYTLLAILSLITLKCRSSTSSAIKCWLIFWMGLKLTPTSSRLFETILIAMSTKLNYF